MSAGCCPTSMRRSAPACRALALTPGATQASPGCSCCSKPANGKARASAYPTRWTATGICNISRHASRRILQVPSKVMPGRCKRPAATGNTTTCESTSSRWRCCICFASRCRTCLETPLPGPAGRVTTGAGRATTTAGSSWAASACSRCLAARTGAAGCRLAASIKP